LLTRLTKSLTGRWQDLRQHPLLNPEGRRELRKELAGGHPADTRHRPHLVEAIEWLGRAQDATPDDGFARGYSVLYSRYFGDQGWQPSYPETTGYIIPTLLHASQFLDRPQLAERALRAARWEIEVQLESGAVQGGVIGERRSPAVFNTGQVIFGWLAAYESSGAAQFAEAAVRAGRYLVSVQASSRPVTSWKWFVRMAGCRDDSARIGRGRYPGVASPGKPRWRTTGCGCA